MADFSRILKRKFRGEAVRPDLYGASGLNRSRVWNPISAERMLAERLGYFVNGVLRRAAPELKERFIRERLSAPFPTHRVGRTGGAKWIKLPFTAGLRKKTGNLQRSVRITVTSPGTTATRFKGNFRLSAKVGGGAVQYAHRHENEGRMQFGRVTTEAYAALVAEIKSGVAQIAAEFGGTVS